MDALQRKRLVELHRDSLKLHGATADALHWASRGQQKVRFRVLSEIGMAGGDSLLDVGCGFADLHDWLGRHGLPLDYTGVDISPEFVAIAAERHADAMLLCGELFDAGFEAKSFDWVVLSGTLNWQLDDDGAYARRVIACMFELCRFGIGFNMLDVRHREMRQLHDLVAFDPDKVLDWCSAITPDCTCRADYLPGDFTVYMRRVG